MTPKDLIVENRVDVSQIEDRFDFPNIFHGKLTMELMTVPDSQKVFFSHLKNSTLFYVSMNCIDQNYKI
jgi:hypothetical protein